MAARSHGEIVAPRKATSQRCSAFNTQGVPCGSWAARDSDPDHPLCSFHARTPEEQKAFSAQGTEASKAALRMRGGIRRTTGHRRTAPEGLAHRAVEVIGELLDATIPTGFNQAEPNMHLRAIGVYLLATWFKLYDREKVIELLEEIRPSLAHDPQLDRLLAFDAARERLRDVYLNGEIDREDMPPDVLRWIEESLGVAA